MKILMLEPMQAPKAITIDHSLESMQSIVGGLIEAVFPFDDSVALICNDEGKLLGLPFNRALRDENGAPYDLVCGTCFLCGAPEDSDDFDDLTPEQLAYYTDYFRHPEMAIRTGKGLTIVKL